MYEVGWVCTCVLSIAWVAQCGFPVFTTSCNHSLLIRPQASCEHMLWALNTDVIRMSASGTPWPNTISVAEERLHTFMNAYSEAETHLNLTSLDCLSQLILNRCLQERDVIGNIMKFYFFTHFKWSFTSPHIQSVWPMRLSLAGSDHQHHLIRITCIHASEYTSCCISCSGKSMLNWMPWFKSVSECNWCKVWSNNNAPQLQHCNKSIDSYHHTNQGCHKTLEETKTELKLSLTLSVTASDSHTYEILTLCQVSMVATSWIRICKPFWSQLHLEWCAIHVYASSECLSSDVGVLL